MGVYELQVNANLVSVETLSCRHPDFVWHMKIQCQNCNEVTSTWQPISLARSFHVASGRSSFNYVAKCKLCRNDMKISVMSEHIADYTADDSEHYKKIVCFDCRGVKPVEFLFGNVWTVKSSSGESYEDVDLTEDSGHWVNYEETSQTAMEISNILYRFVLNNS